VILGGVHHIEGGEVDATDGAAPATDAAMRLREEPEIIGVDAGTPHTGCKGEGQKPSLLFCFAPRGRGVLAGVATKAYLDRTQVSVR
jgi:hypothetical protein